MVWENLGIGCSAPQFKLVARHWDAGARKINAGAHKGIIGDFFWASGPQSDTGEDLGFYIPVYTPPNKSYQCMIYVLVQLILH